MQSAADGALAVLVTLSWGSPQWPGYALGRDPEGGVVRYTDWPSPLTFSTTGHVFAPVEAMKVTLGEAHGGAQDEPFTLRIPGAPGVADATGAITGGGVEPFVNALRYGEAACECTVEEADPADATGATRLVLARGTLKESRPVDRSALIDATFAGIRRRAEVALGLLIDSSCNSQFGDAACGRVLGDYSFPSKVTSIVGRTVKAAILATTPTVNGKTLTSSWGRFGRAVRGGVSIPIADHAPGTDTVTLEYEPPPGWLDRFVIFAAGCNKSIDACRNSFDNEASFTGLGVAIPPENPLLRTGA